MTPAMEVRPRAQGLEASAANRSRMMERRSLNVSAESSFKLRDGVRCLPEKAE